MSVFNALSTAVSGINAQSTAFTNLSNNIANSQTVGYKANTTSFQDFVAGSLTGGGSSGDVSDSVSAVTVQHLDNAGTTSTSTDALATAISGDGMFVVSKSTGAATAGTTTFSSQDYYTRNGEVYENKAGYLVNTSGYYLDGYAVDSKTGVLGTTLTQLNVANVTFRPTQTTTLTTSGTLAASSTGTGAPITTDTTTVYDGQYDQTNPTASSGTVSLQWQQTGTNTWTVKAVAATTPASDTTGTVAIGNGSTSATTSTYSADGPSYTVTFNSDGSLASVKDTSGTNVTSTLNGATATIPIVVQYGDGSTQAVNVNLGTIGSTSSSSSTIASTTAGTSSATLTSDSVTSGTYEGISIQSDGSIMAQFDNGDTQLVGKIALANFANVNGLNAVDGQAYTSTSASGTAQLGVSGDNGTGTLSVGHVESSTTDLTSDLSALIVAQQAYSANTKIVTTADQLLQMTIAMKQ